MHGFHGSSVLESAINRVGDIPGQEIPLAYHDFVRTNDGWLMKSILHHNALGLVTSLEVALRLRR